MAGKVLQLLRETRLGGVVTAPVIYCVAIPFLILDLFVTVYQQICFRVYGIPLVKRSKHVVIDRDDLPHMTWRERFNCAYCDYAQGVLAYVGEVVYRTEHFWCPVKHKSNVHHQQGPYESYMDHDATDGYSGKLWHFRRTKCRACKGSCTKT